MKPNSQNPPIPPNAIRYADYWLSFLDSRGIEKAGFGATETYMQDHKDLISRWLENDISLEELEFEVTKICEG